MVNVDKSFDPDNHPRGISFGLTNPKARTMNAKTITVNQFKDVSSRSVGIRIAELED